MSLFLDKQFLNQISYRFEKFTKRGEHTFNCRCPLCGDSAKDKNKARGYFYKAKHGLRYKCFNCASNLSFGDMLKHLDGDTFKQYMFERYKEDGKTVSAPTTEQKKQTAINRPKVTEELDVKFSFFIPLKHLLKSHIAWEYILSRKIPEKHWNKFYFIEKSKFLNAVDDRYEGKFKTDEPRICLPYHNKDGRIVGITARALTPTANKYKYLIVRLDENEPLIYGIDRLKQTEQFYVVEGPIDSLFLNNAIAASTLDLTRVTDLVKIENASFIFDNQPRNKDVCRIMEKSIAAGLNVFIWPDYINSKDINEAIITEEIEADLIEEIIDLHSFEGLEAKNEFIQWRKC